MGDVGTLSSARFGYAAAARVGQAIALASHPVFAAAALDLALVLNVTQALLGERWSDRSDPPPVASRVTIGDRDGGLMYRLSTCAGAFALDAEEAIAVD